MSTQHLLCVSDCAQRESLLSATATTTAVAAAVATGTADPAQCCELYCPTGLSERTADYYCCVSLLLPVVYKLPQSGGRLVAIIQSVNITL
jgi:hypothetical protein